MIRAGNNEVFGVQCEVGAWLRNIWEVFPVTIICVLLPATTLHIIRPMTAIVCGKAIYHTAYYKTDDNYYVW